MARHTREGRSYNFVVDRINSPQVLDGYFEYPDSSDYDPKNLLEGAFGIFVQQDASEYDVELVFPDVKWLKLYVREREWQRGQRLKDLADGRLRLSFTVTSLDTLKNAGESKLFKHRCELGHGIAQTCCNWCGVG